MDVYELGEYSFQSCGTLLSELLNNISPKDIMDFVGKKLELSPYISRVHSAWAKHYIHWKNNLQSVERITTRVRDRRATTDVNNLPKSDLGFYQDLITEVFEALAQIILSAGMSSLSI